ncbi:deleted in malignant brain tumors 1 protein-like [Dreissena polymorpha]|uniref:deleted in malignant brain tumors 1 protein-like n=1 Tax=Dreissena polymorpha TaxID=45954 RepID=UPI0022645E03|nr:deleted in malignant brain tumors 1 protein-like [Dreissena polymorpha]
MFGLPEMVNSVLFLLFVCVSGAVGQMTTRTVVTRKFRYETACWDQFYGSPMSGWDFYKITSKEKCQMKCVDAGLTCIAFFWRQTASWCRLNQVKHANRTLDCASWEHVVYAEETTEDTPHFGKPSTYSLVCIDACTNAVTKPDGTSWRLCDGGGAGVCDPKKGRIEVNIGGTWGTVCDDGWEYGSGYSFEPYWILNLDVTCRTFGYSGSTGVSRYEAFFGMGTGLILMDDVNCTGSEMTLTQCSYISNHNCDHSEDQGVECL